jgi:hypothetical protein
MYPGGIEKNFSWVPGANSWEKAKKYHKESTMPGKTLEKNHFFAA